uniref:N-acetyltransferase 9 n=1 Tax=Parasteatoda tepidariorum TaxID=114398 RepID=A0A2L2YL15_PARTP
MKQNSKTKIIGKKVILVPYKKIHVEKYHRWMQNEELLELTASEPLTLEQEYEMQISWLEDEDKCTFIVLDKSILDHTGDEIASMIGDVNLYLNNDGCDKEAEIEVMIADIKHRSMGKGKESLLFMLRYGIDTLGITKFVAKIKMKNEKSLNLFKNIGFIQTGESIFFQEIELTCHVTNNWKKGLNEQTDAYQIEEIK